MASDKLVGGAILIVSVLVLIAVTVFMWVPPFSQYAAFVAELVVWLAVVALMVIAAWIGWTIITTAPPPPLESEKPAQGASSASSGASSNAGAGGGQGQGQQGGGAQAEGSQSKQ